MPALAQDVRLARLLEWKDRGYDRLQDVIGLVLTGSRAIGATAPLPWHWPELGQRWP